MMKSLLLFLVFEFVHSENRLSLSQWLNDNLHFQTAPVTYVFKFEHADSPIIYENARKRTAFNTRETFVSTSKITKDDDTDDSTRNKRSSSILQPKNIPELNLKANLRYHHQQRHTNGSVSGTYGQMDPKNGQLKVMHYVRDSQGYREFPDGNEFGSLSQTSNQHLQYQPYQQSTTLRPLAVTVNTLSNTQSNVDSTPHSVGHNNNRRGINPLDGSNLNFLPHIAAPYNVPQPVSGVQTTPILHSAAGTVQQYSPKSPLFDKYYRPSQDEIQRSYEYHRLRSMVDPNSIRPQEATSIPDVPRDKQPELRSTYSEYQVPYTVRYKDETPAGYYVYQAPDTPQHAPPLVTPQAVNIPPPQELYQMPQQIQYIQQDPYPQTLQPQVPAYQPAYEGQQFVPASAYSGPYMPNSATFNQPYPTNLPIYNSPVPQNTATFSHPPPENVPVYQAPAAPGYGQNVYYATSGSAPQAVISSSKTKS